METRSLTLCLLAQVCCGALAQAQSPNVSGTWNVEIRFAAGGQHSLRFDAKPDGKGPNVISKVDLLGQAWKPPTLVGTKLYVRDRSKIIALDLT